MYKHVKKDLKGGKTCETSKPNNIKNLDQGFQASTYVHKI